MGQEVGAREEVRDVDFGWHSPQAALRSSISSLWLLGGGAARQLRALPLPAGAIPTAPIGWGSWPTGAAEPALGVGAACRAPVATPMPWSQTDMLAASQELHGSGQAPCLPCCGRPTGILKAWSAVLTRAARVPFQQGIPVKNWTPGNPSPHSKQPSYRDNSSSLK